MKIILQLIRMKFFLLFSCLFLPLLETAAQDDFRVYPYLQNPSSCGMTIIWFSNDDIPGKFSYSERNSGEVGGTINSDPIQIQDLSYSNWENENFFGGLAPSPPFRHRIRLDYLKPHTVYEYSVFQGGSSFNSTFTTSPVGNAPVRIIFYGDCETEPESVNNFTDWPDPVDGSSRPYLTDQATGYSNNLEVIRSRKPDLIFIAGDLVESGGEQRDWDEFWSNNTNMVGEKSLGSQIPILAASGNHDYFEGPYLDQYNQPGSERAIKRYLSYFEFPANNSVNKAQEGRYYSLLYGPATFIILDVCNNGTNKSDDDTNFYLLGESDPGGGNAPDINQGSDQYIWLESQLQEAQIRTLFTFVIFHHSPYSTGPHGFPPGETENTDNQSGYPLRSLTGLFMHYGVDAVISGHDEIWERSEIHGTEIKPDNSEEAHIIQFYDVGTGGDGLRGPEKQITNPYQDFIVHEDVPEVWQNNILLSGGKHYGHLELDIEAANINKWTATFIPVYIFPLFDATNSLYFDYERRLYDDEVIITRDFKISNSTFTRIYPNPFKEKVTIEYFLEVGGETSVMIYGLEGRNICTVNLGNLEPGFHSFLLDTADAAGQRMSNGIYFCRIKTGNGIIETNPLILFR